MESSEERESPDNTKSDSDSDKSSNSSQKSEKIIFNDNSKNNEEEEKNDDSSVYNQKLQKQDNNGSKNSNNNNTENDNDDDKLSNSSSKSKKSISIDNSQNNKHENSKSTVKHSANKKLISSKSSSAGNAKQELTKKAFKTHQIPNLILFGSAFLFGVTLIIFSGFAWSLPLLLGLGFLIPSGLAFANSILLMKPGSPKDKKIGIKHFVAKILRNCAWIIGGAALITLGEIFCSGLVAASLITFGALGVATGILKAIIGSQSYFLNTHREMEQGRVNKLDEVHWECWIYKAFNILAFIGTGILGVLLTLAPISLPFLPLIGIGIAALSVFGIVKSVLHMFLGRKASHVKCYQTAKYFKCGMFILGGVALIALTFLPITTALAGIVGTPAILLKIACLVIGAFLSIKGGMPIRQDYSIVECILASRECDYISFDSKGDSWRENRSFFNTLKIEGDITCATADACFGLMGKNWEIK